MANQSGTAWPLFNYLTCVFVLVCLVRVRGDLFSFFGWCAIHMYFHVSLSVYVRFWFCKDLAIICMWNWESEKVIFIIHVLR